MEKSTVIGLVAGLALVCIAVFTGEGSRLFLDLPSALIVLGGTLTALVAGFTVAELRQVPKLVVDLFRHHPADRTALGRFFGDLARTGRKEGLISLEGRLKELSDPALRFGLELVLDGADEETIEKLLAQHTETLLARQRVVTRFFKNAATYAPAFGMVGTLIGLIQMLHSLNSPEQIGQAMSLAMITTFYGAILANVVFLPLAARSRTHAEDIIRDHEMIRMGALALVRGESPLAIERQLGLFTFSEEAPSRSLRALKLDRVA